MTTRLMTAMLVGMALRAQTPCPPTPQYTPCDIAVDLPPAGNLTVNLEAEFRSPHQATALVKAFPDGDSRWIIRFTPSEAGAYVYRIRSSVAELNGKEGQFTATSVAKPGWLRAANIHHFAFADGNTLTPHLWMGAMVPGFRSLDLTAWKALVDQRAAQHFNHLGVTLVDAGAASTFDSPEFFRAAEEKIRYANQHGLIVDLCFFGGSSSENAGVANKLLPTREARRKWFTYAIARLAAFDVTWQGIEAWETYDNGRALLKEIADYLSELDPYKHVRSTRTTASSGALADDGWLRYRSYQTGDPAIGAVEQQVYQYPAVNNFSNALTDADIFRHRLWSAAMNGQYPAAEIPNEQAANQMKLWYEFMADARHWETEPFFDATGPDDALRGLALEGVEYIVYVEKPGPVTVNIEDRRYDGAWFNPVNGQLTKIKEVKGPVFTGEPPDRSHDWVPRLPRRTESLHAEELQV
jgi:hypothetical protein